MLFIVGGAGSGSTMLLRLIASFDRYIAVGGNYVSPGYKSVADDFRAMTESRWHRDPTYRRLIVPTIPVLPPNREFVFKRSYPFDSNGLHYPDVTDWVRLWPDSKIVWITRDLDRRAQSMYRRGLCETLAACKRSAVIGEQLLEEQFDKLQRDIFHVVSYESLVSHDELSCKKLAEYLSLPERLMIRKVNRIVKEVVHV